MNMMLLTALLLVGAGAEDETPTEDQRILATLRQDNPRDQAVDAGLRYLRDQQTVRGAVGKRYPTALTGLAVMAHLAAGVTPADPEHGEWLRRGAEFVLSQQDADGYFGRSDGSRMYGHGIATLMLAELLGEATGDRLEERVRTALEKAVRVTVAAARVPKDDRNRGGWRYEPDSRDSDLSLSGWQILGLHATQQVGITVPPAVVEAAIEYARRLTDDEGRVGYTSPHDDRPALRGLALLCLMLQGEDVPPEVARVVARMQEDPIRWERGQWLYYRVYYDAVGLSRAAPDSWRTYGSALESMLLERQQADGSWPTPPGSNEGGEGPEYRTAMAVLALAVDRYVLPAYQR